MHSFTLICTFILAFGTILIFTRLRDLGVCIYPRPALALRPTFDVASLEFRTSQSFYVIQRELTTSNDR